MRAALRKCDLTGQKANNGWAVSFSHSRSHKLQGVNLQYKRIYWPEKQRWVQLRISAKARLHLQLACSVVWLLTGAACCADPEDHPEARA